MAKDVSKLRSFFDGKRRECNLKDYHVLQDTQGRKRITLAVMMPLSNKPATGMPEEFAEQFMVMGREDSCSDFSKVSVTVQGATCDIFHTDVSNRAASKSIGAELQNFRMIGSGKKEKREIALHFTLTASHTDTLLDWADKHLHMKFWLEVVPSQMELKEEKEPKDKKAKTKPPPEKAANGKVLPLQ